MISQRNFLTYLRSLVVIGRLQCFVEAFFLVQRFYLCLVVDSLLVNSFVFVTLNFE